MLMGQRRKATVSEPECCSFKKLDVMAPGSGSESLSQCWSWVSVELNLAAC